MPTDIIIPGPNVEATTSLVNSMTNLTDLDSGAAPTAGRIYRTDGAAGSVVKARANTIAGARGIVGVGDSALGIARAGRVRIVADSTCAPAINGEAYLSDEAGGLVASAIDGGLYPRLVGYFAEGAVAVDGTVAVWLAIDEMRDDCREWLLESWAPTVDTQVKDFTFTPGLFRDVRLLADFGDDTAEEYADLRVDGASPTVYHSGLAYAGLTAGQSTFRVGGTNKRTCSDTLLTRYALKWSVYSFSIPDSNGESGVINMTAVAPTTSIGLAGTTADTFRGNQSTVKFYGKVALS